MKAYFIDAKNEFIVEVDTKNYDHRRELIRARNIETYPYQVNGNDIITDEESNLKEYNFFFTIDDYVVSGSALIMGVDYDEGDWIAPKNLTLEELKKRVTFMGKRYIDHDKLFSQFKIEELKI
jgi:hypothetical protein